MTLHLAREQVTTLRRYAVDERTCECCGILVGRCEGEAVHVLEVHPVANRWEPPRDDRYLIDPREHLRLQREARERGLEIVGFYHSHPSGGAEPSACDRELAWPGPCYLIITKDALRAWQFAADSGYSELAIVMDGSQGGL